jgi:hypothetical protein
LAASCNDHVNATNIDHDNSSSSSDDGSNDIKTGIVNTYYETQNEEYEHDYQRRREQQISYRR